MGIQLRKILLLSLLLMLSCQLIPHYNKETLKELNSPHLVGDKNILDERRELLYQESIARALQKITNISYPEARTIVTLIYEQISLYEGLDPLQIVGFIVAESHARVYAESYAGALGLMQIMPATGRFIAANFSEEWKGSRCLYNVETNIKYGVWYLYYLGQIFPGDHQAIVAAYNWGPDNIKRRLEKKRPLPRVYPRKVREAIRKLEDEIYVYYHRELWRFLNLRHSPTQPLARSTRPKNRC